MILVFDILQNTVSNRLMKIKLKGKKFDHNTLARIRIRNLLQIYWQQIRWLGLFTIITYLAIYILAYLKVISMNNPAIIAYLPRQHIWAIFECFGMFPPLSCHKPKLFPAKDRKLTIFRKKKWHNNIFKPSEACMMCCI